jgi:hypothetical protein
MPYYSAPEYKHSPKCLYFGMEGCQDVLLSIYPCQYNEKHIDFGINESP